MMTVLASNPGVTNPGVSGVPAHQAPALADCTWGPGSTAPQNHVGANQGWGHGGRRTQRKQERDVRDWAFSTFQSTHKQVNDELQQVIMLQNRHTQQLQVGHETQTQEGSATASGQPDDAGGMVCNNMMIKEIKEECPPNQDVTLCEKDKDAPSDPDPSGSISGNADLEALKRKAPDTCSELPLHRCVFRVS